MHDRNLSPELEALVQGYIDGSLAPEECNRLLRVLKEQPELNRVILAELQMDELLHTVTRSNAEGAEIRNTLAEGRTNGTLEWREAALDRRLPEDCAEESSLRPFRRASRSSHWAIAAGLVGVAGLVTWFATWFGVGRSEHPLQFAPLSAQIVEVSGTAAVDRASRRIAIQAGMPLQSGDLLVTGAGSLARFKFDAEETWVELASGTELRVSMAGDAKRLELHRGRFEAEVAPQPEGRPMTCITPQGRATVLGTRFFLTALPKQERLEVMRGTVQLETHDDGADRTRVRSGEVAVVERRPGLKVERFGGQGIYQAESLTVVASEGGHIITESHEDASGGYYRTLHANKPNGSISFAVPIEAPGRYQLYLRSNQRSNRGIYQVSVNGQPIREPFDFSRRGGVPRFVELHFGIFEVTAPGMQVFTFENRGKAGHAASYKLAIDYIQIKQVRERVPAPSGPEASPTPAAPSR
jgi:ferric-dicitrate binding protein FerR (iron transport regulator)